MLPPPSESPPRFSVLHVAAPGSVGGLESVIRLLARGQARAGHQVRVAAVLDSGPTAHPFCQALEGGGIEVLPVRLPPRAYRAEWRALRDQFRRLAPDVVHTHGARTDVIAGWAAGSAGRPRVSTAHGFTGGDRKNRFYEWVQERVLCRFDAVVAVSESVRARLADHGVPADRLHLVRNAWETTEAPLARAVARARLGLSPDGPVLGWVGRLSREKGLDLLLDALPHLDPEIRVAVVGAGRERPALEAQLARLGLADRVSWCGELADAGRLFPAFDVFVLSSRSEGTPMVLFEAMAARVPVVATRVGGVPDVLGDDHAWLVSPEDPAALARGLGAALAAPAQAGARARAAAQRLTRDFGVEAWVAAYAAVYARVTRPRAAA